MDASKSTRYTAARSRGPQKIETELIGHASSNLAATDASAAEHLDYWGAAPFQPLCSLHHTSREQRHIGGRGGGTGELKSTSAPPQSSDYDYLARLNDSQYHERCVVQKAGRQLSPRPPMTTAELRKADVVSQDKIWKEAVSAETDATGKWQNMWGFLLDYDARGRPVERAVARGDSASVPVVPRTNAGNYGARQNTEVGQTMLKLEHQLSSNTRKKKLSSEMICY